MKMRLFLDTNIVIDYIGHRMHFLSAATFRETQFIMGTELHPGTSSQSVDNQRE